MDQKLRDKKHGRREEFDVTPLSVLHTSMESWMSYRRMLRIYPC
jgi:hypothetical protein